MSIPTECPHCNASYRLADSVAGKRVVCRHCNKAFIVRPAPGTGEKPESSERASASPQFRARPAPPAARRQPGRRTQLDVDEDAAPVEGSNRVLWIAAFAGGGFVLLLGAVIATWAIATRGSAPPPQAARSNAPAETVAISVRSEKAPQDAAPLEAANAAESKPSPPISKLATPSDAPDNSRRTGGEDVASSGLQANTGSGGKLSAAMLRRLKEATVFIKREAGQLSATGSGFVMRIDGEAAYIVTNHHVIDPTGERLSISRTGRIQIVKVRASSAIILAVFRSGTREERALNAEVVASDPSRDLAVLKVNGVKDFARAIDLERKAELMETMPVYILGFPFGRSLSLKKGNPNITINKGSISSLRENDQGQMKAVQIDGALNPGNSGGPVVDEQGHLVGVAVATIEGSGIGLAIAPEELTRMLQGRVGGISFTKRYADRIVTLQLEAPLIDPMGQMKSVFLHYARTNPTREKPKMDREGRFAPLSDAQDIALKMDNQRATGTLPLEVADSAGYDIDYQMAYVNGAGTLIYTAPGTYHVDTRMAATVPPVAAGQNPSGRASPPRNLSLQTLPRSKASSSSLAGERRAVEDLSVTPLNLNASAVPPCLCWSTDGASFFVLEGSTGTLRSIALDGFVERRSLQLGRKCSWLSMSAEGVVVTVSDLQEVWVVRPNDLQVTGRIAVPGLRRAVSAPAISMGVAASNDRLYVLDLKKNRSVKEYTFQNFTTGLLGFSDPALTPDGKYLFTRGGIEQLHRFELKGGELHFQESSQRICQGAFEAICVSPDSKYVCMPCGGGNYQGLSNHPEIGSYATYIYPVTNINRPEFTLEQGAYPEAVGFDPAAGYVYGQNIHHQLIVFSGTGIKKKEYSLGDRGDVRQFLAHPQGRKLLLHTGAQILYVEVPRL